MNNFWPAQTLTMRLCTVLSPELLNGEILYSTYPFGSLPLLHLLLNLLHAIRRSHSPLSSFLLLSCYRNRLFLAHARFCLLSHIIHWLPSHATPFLLLWKDIAIRFTAEAHIQQTSIEQHTP